MSFQLETFLYLCSRIWERPIGAWRSWLAHLHGVQGVGSSSLLAPTVERSGRQCLSWLFCFQSAAYIIPRQSQKIALSREAIANTNEINWMRWVTGDRTILELTTQAPPQSAKNYVGRLKGFPWLATGLSTIRDGVGKHPYR